MNSLFMFRVGKATSSQLQRLIRIEKIEAERLLTEAYNLPTGECI
jgi:hypothetical protein